MVTGLFRDRESAERAASSARVATPAFALRSGADYHATSRSSCWQIRVELFKTNGFTAHSLRHTYITDLMQKTGNDAGTVMKYSGHKPWSRFQSTYIPRSRGGILATEAMESVGLLLGGFEGHQGQRDSAQPLCPKRAQPIF